ncbi:unnamed protein product, partial [Ectocarpus fasciculatus]
HEGAGPGKYEASDCSDASSSPTAWKGAGVRWVLTQSHPGHYFIDIHEMSAGPTFRPPILSSPSTRRAGEAIGAAAAGHVSIEAGRGTGGGDGGDGGTDAPCRALGAYLQRVGRGGSGGGSSTRGGAIGTASQQIAGGVGGGDSPHRPSGAAFWG